MRPRGAILLAATLLLAPAVAAVATAQTTAQAPTERVSSSLVVALGPDLSRARMEGVVAVHRVEVDLGPYTPCTGPCDAGELRSFYRSSPALVQAFIVREVEHAAADRVRQALSTMAGERGLEDLRVTIDQESLQATSTAGAESAPVVVHLAANLTLPQLARSGLTAEQVRALFDAGARAQLPLSVPVPPGHDLALTLDTPEGLAVRNGSQAPWRDAPTFHVDNGDGQRTQRVVEHLLLANPNASRALEPAAGADVTLDLSRVEPVTRVWEGRLATIQARMTLRVDLSALALSQALPQGIELPALSAEGLRDLMEVGLVGPTVLDRYEEVARQQLEVSMEDTFGQDVEVRGGWVRASLEPGAPGPLRLEVVGTTNLSMPRSTPAVSSRGLTLTTVPLPELRLPRVEPLDTHVRSLAITVPPGTTLVHGAVVNGTLAQLEGTEQTYQLVDPTPRHSPAAVHDPALAVSPGLLWALYGGAIVIVAAAVGAVGAWVVYKRTIGR